MTSASTVPAPRRFGRVNWIGLATFASRDLRRTLKTYRYSLLGPLVSNMLFLAVFQLALGDRVWALSTIDFGQFLVAGLVVFAICERAFETSSESILYEKMEGMIWDTLMAPLSSLERTIGYTIGAASVGLLTGTIVLAASLLFVRLPAPNIPLLLFFAVSGAVVLALGGIIAGIWAERWDHQSAISTFLLLPISFLSGCYYPIGGLPEIGRQLIQLNPVFYIVDGVRAALTGFHEGSLQTGAVVLLSMTAVLFVLVHRLIRSGYKVRP
jgi:ABC-2 type transport system permease protein